MLESCTSQEAYDEVIVTMSNVIDRCPQVGGTKVSRLELWHGSLLPDQHDHLGVWGCADYMHLDHGSRGKITNIGNMDSKVELCILIRN